MSDHERQDFPLHCVGGTGREEGRETAEERRAKKERDLRLSWMGSTKLIHWGLMGGGT